MTPQGFEREREQLIQLFCKGPTLISPGLDCQGLATDHSCNPLPQSRFPLLYSEVCSAQTEVIFGIIHVTRSYWIESATGTEDSPIGLDGEVGK